MVVMRVVGLVQLWIISSCVPVSCRWVIIRALCNGMMMAVVGLLLLLVIVTMAVDHCLAMRIRVCSLAIHRGR